MQKFYRYICPFQMLFCILGSHRKKSSYPSTPKSLIIVLLCLQYFFEAMVRVVNKSLSIKQLRRRILGYQKRAKKILPNVESNLFLMCCAQFDTCVIFYNFWRGNQFFGASVENIQKRATILPSQVLLGNDFTPKLCQSILLT